MSDFNQGATAPASGGFNIPSGVQTFSAVTRAIYVGAGGDVEVVFIDASTALFAAVPAGVCLPVRAKGVTANTTATNLVGLL
jgi:hypothetical protein